MKSKTPVKKVAKAECVTCGDIEVFLGMNCAAVIHNSKKHGHSKTSLFVNIMVGTPILSLPKSKK